MIRQLIIVLAFFPVMASAGSLGSLVDLSFSNSVYFVEGSELRHAAQLGDVESQFQLAWQHSQRADSNRLPGIAYNPKQALNWYQKAAKQGHASSAYNLAVIYAQGRGTVSDAIEAYAWLDYAADIGHGPSKNLLPDFEKALSEAHVAQALQRQQKNIPSRLLNDK